MIFKKTVNAYRLDNALLGEPFLEDFDGSGALCRVTGSIAQEQAVVVVKVEGAVVPGQDINTGAQVAEDADLVELDAVVEGGYLDLAGLVEHLDFLGGDQVDQVSAVRVCEVLGLEDRSRLRVDVHLGEIVCVKNQLTKTVC